MVDIKNKIFSIITIILLFLLFFSGCLDNTNADKNEIYVSKNSDADYHNIQDAIREVAVGGTIYVEEGTYNESLIINKPINLIGKDNGKTIIYQSLQGVNFDSVIKVISDNCTIKDLNIMCYRIDASIEIIGINISSSNNTISNNTINGSGKGIYLSKNTINNYVIGNTISNSSNGIYSYGSNNNNILENKISLCIIYGMYILSSDNNNIFNNLIFDNNNYGIRIKGSTDNMVFNNSILNNKQGVLCCCGALDNIIYNNIFEQNTFWNAADEVENQWDNGKIGNYWDDYTSKYQNATQKDGIWNTPYNITDGDNIDRYPLVNKPEI